MLYFLAMFGFIVFPFSQPIKEQTPGRAIYDYVTTLISPPQWVNCFFIGCTDAKRAQPRSVTLTCCLIMLDYEPLHTNNSQSANQPITMKLVKRNTSPACVGWRNRLTIYSQVHGSFKFKKNLFIPSMCAVIQYSKQASLWNLPWLTLGVQTVKDLRRLAR